MKSFLFGLIPLVIFSSCLAVPAQSIRPRLDDDGLVLVYLRPFDRDASAFTFTLTGASAIREDGREIPLSLGINTVNGAEMGRQRLLCEGTLPQGAYTGFSLAVGSASIAGEEGSSDLLLPEKPARVDFAFRIAPRSASLLSAAFNASRSVTAEFSFTPVFTIAPAPKTVAAVQAYVSNYASYSLTVLDKNSMQAAGAVALRRGARGIVFDQRQRRLYAAIPDEAVVEVIDTSAGEVVNTIQLRLGDAPQSLALSPNGKSLLVLNTGSNTVSVVDLLQLIETARISVGNGAASLLLDRSGRRAYVFNTLSDTVSVVDVANRAVAATVSTETAPHWGQFNAKGDRLYIIYGMSPYMTVLDPLSLTVVSRVFVGPGLTSLKVDPLTDLIYAGRKNDPEVAIYDPFSLLPVDFIVAGEPASYLTIDGEGNNLWVIGAATGKLIVANLASKKIVSEIDIGGEPFWLTMTGER